MGERGITHMGDEGISIRTFPSPDLRATDNFSFLALRREPRARPML